MRDWTVLTAVCLASTAFGEFMMPKEIPYEKLVVTAKKKVAANPKSAEAHYILGRLYSVAYARGSQIQVYERNGDFQFPAWTSVQVVPNDKPLTNKTRDQLYAGIAEYSKAIELSPSNALYALGRGWMIEQVAAHFEKNDKLVKNKNFPSLKIALDMATTDYRQAYALAKDADLRNQNPGLSEDTYISVEAGANLLRLAAAGKIKMLDTEKGSIASTVKTLRARPRPITPLIVPLDRQGPLTNLLSDKQVTFSLDGSLSKRTWSWVKPNTGILVWDPKYTGKITSGIQLFSSVSFWLFPSDGFSALSLLDSNLDGWIDGKELKGIAVWIDKNSNGVSERGEVASLGSLGIVGLKTSFTHLSLGMKTAVTGVRYSDGSSGPLYDWIAKSQ